MSKLASDAPEIRMRIIFARITPPPCGEAWAIRHSAYIGRGEVL